MKNIKTSNMKSTECPYCNKQTIPIHWQCEDNSGWTSGWTCNCFEIKKIEGNLQLLYGKEE
jgi:hypothetical protein